MPQNFVNGEYLLIQSVLHYTDNSTSDVDSRHSLSSRINSVGKRHSAHEALLAPLHFFFP